MATLTVRQHLEPSIGKHARARAAALTQDLRDQRQDWYDIAMLSGHPRIEFLLWGSHDKGDRPRLRTLHDGHATRSFRYLEGGMYSGLSSPNRPWFKFRLGGKIEEGHAARVWLDECEDIVAEMLAGSNFYSVARANYGELGKFGNAAGIMDEDFEKGVSCTALTAGEYSFSTNYQGEVDTLLRLCRMDTRQVVQKFVRQPDGAMDWGHVTDQVKQAWANSNYAMSFTVFHLIEPNEDWREGAVGRDGMQWGSVKWLAGQPGDRILEHRGYHEKPFWVPRWKVYGGSDYGVGPGHDALPDMRELQFQAKRKGEVTDMVVKPATQGPPKVLKLKPGSHTAVANIDHGKVEVIYQAPYQAIGLVAEDVQRCRQAIDEATYADLFMAISEREGVQPLNDLESTLRNDEKMTQLGPVIERVNNDMLAVAVERAFGVAMRGDLLPPPPEEIEGREIDIEFVSVLAQAQKMMGMGQTERTLAFAGSVAQFQPDVIDNIDGDELVRDHWSRSGAPSAGLRSEKDIEDIRSQRAQQQQAERMAAMAQPAKDGMEAAKLFNDMGREAP